MDTVATLKEYRLVNVEPYRNVCNGWGIRADLLLDGELLAKIDDAGDGTCTGIIWENKDSEAKDASIEALTTWYAIKDDWYASREPGDGTPDIDEAIWFLRDAWVDTLSNKG